MDPAFGAFIVGLIFWVVIATLVGGLVGSRKGRGGLGALLGFLLGWIGVLIIAIMKPSRQFEEQKTIAQAKVLREAFGGGLVTATPPPSSGVVITAGVRQDLMLEAIRRDPSLAASSDPETLKRLGDTMEALEKEYVLKAELDQLKATQEASAAAAEEAAQNQKLAEERAAAAAAATEAAQVAAQQKAEARTAEIAAMSPVRRFIVTKPIIAVLIVLLVLAGIAAVLYIPLKNKSNQDAEVAAQLAQARSTACESDIDRADSLIGTSWRQAVGDDVMTFTETCTISHPVGKISPFILGTTWQREGSSLTAFPRSTDDEWLFEIQGDVMQVVAINDEPISQGGVNAEKYAFTRVP